MFTIMKMAQNDAVLARKSASDLKQFSTTNFDGLDKSDTTSLKLTDQTIDAKVQIDRYLEHSR